MTTVTNESPSIIAYGGNGYDAREQATILHGSRSKAFSFLPSGGTDRKNVQQNTDVHGHNCAILSWFVEGKEA